MGFPDREVAGRFRPRKGCGLAGPCLHPFHIARAFASLDHISGGRAAWNIVTSATDREAQNYGMDRLLDKAQRYDHADEVVEACTALWNSWGPEALVLDMKKAE